MPVRRLRGKSWGAGLLGLPGSVSFPAARFMARGGRSVVKRAPDQP